MTEHLGVEEQVLRLGERRRRSDCRCQLSVKEEVQRLGVLPPETVRVELAGSDDAVRQAVEERRGQVGRNADAVWVLREGKERGELS